MGEDAPHILVLGIGNLLWADEGWGVRVAEAVHQRFEFPDTVRVMDGGTQGLYLVHHICEADVLLVFDAIDYGLPPGTLKIVEGDDVPRFMGAKKMSLHQTGFQEVISTSVLLGKCPRHMMLIGVQPVELEDFGGSLRDQPKGKMEEAIRLGLDFLARFGIAAKPRQAAADPISSAETALDIYESERPAEDMAFRRGDIRFINRAADGEASSCA
ncbi:MAG: HyaD/HybD family hydrogenase maturation endopeptidase [Rhizobiales bacterium]|nr:HyaD/HybD family hydrogenase maturation endopeptidase [Hyphomicrobiales bacterium]